LLRLWFKRCDAMAVVRGTGVVRCLDTRSAWMMSKGEERLVLFGY
jgi:hypothetical protein